MNNSFTYARMYARSLPHKSPNIRLKMPKTENMLCRCAMMSEYEL